MNKVNISCPPPQLFAKRKTIKHDQADKCGQLSLRLSSVVRPQSSSVVLCRLLAKLERHQYYPLAWSGGEWASAVNSISVFWIDPLNQWTIRSSLLIEVSFGRSVTYPPGWIHPWETDSIPRLYHPWDTESSKWGWVVTTLVRTSVENSRNFRR